MPDFLKKKGSTLYHIQKQHIFTVSDNLTVVNFFDIRNGMENKKKQAETAMAGMILIPIRLLV